MPNVYSDTLTHDATLVWLSPPSRDVIPVGGVAMRTAPPPTVHDDVAVGELATVRVGVALAVVDDTPGTDEPAVAMPIPVRVAEVAAATEAVEGRVSVLEPAVGDDQTPIEAVTLALPLAGVQVGDDLPPSDAVTLRMGLVVADDLIPADAVAVAMPVGAVATDTALPTESVDLALNVLTVRVGDDVPVGEAVDRRQPITLEVSDTTVVGERRVAEMVAPKKIKIHGKPGQAGTR
ncbi:MAG TPA: hypothetical protein VLA89_19605 [Gemmatimonadales bacterium]|nr:hypothetical protein [Gemmatimonadales bacterium]